MILVALFCFIIALVQPHENVSELHEFHLSKCDIDYNVQESALQISISIFIDDLELALAEKGFDSLAICTIKEAYNAEALIFDYLKDHLRLKVDNHSLEYTWVGKEVSEDLAAVWCYLQIEHVTPRFSIDVENDVLMHLFEDQQNLVKLKFDKKRKSFFLFDKEEYSGRLEL